MALAISTVLVGCGATSSEKAADRVRATAHAYFLALGNQDYAGACEQMSTAAQKELVGVAAVLGDGTCASAAKIGLGTTGQDQLGPLRTDKIVILSLVGNTATARREHGHDVLHLRRYGTRWLIDKGATGPTTPSTATTGSALVTVPGVLGRNDEQAAVTLRTAGLASTVTDATHQGRPLAPPTAWHVVFQKPAAGSKVPSDTTITLYSKKYTDP